MKNANRLKYAKNRPTRGSCSIYPTAYRWISAPTPVTTSAIVIARGSTRRVQSTANDPAEIHSNSSTAWASSSPGREAMSSRTRTATTNPAAIAADATHPARLPSRRRANRFTVAPGSGRAGISQTRSSIPSTPQDRGVVHACALPAPVDGHDDRESDHDLGGGDHHREEGQDLAVQVVVHPAERHEGEVHRVQLELDRHEDHERVLADEHPDRADREQHRRHDHEVGDRRPHAAASSASEAACAFVTDRRCRDASTTTAIAATISRIEVTSNGKK